MTGMNSTRSSARTATRWASNHFPQGSRARLITRPVIIMTEEYGTPIPVNGKRPDWLGDDDMVRWHRTVGGGPFWDKGGGMPARQLIWNEHIQLVRLKSDHPYYQSAEYRASVIDTSSEPEDEHAFADLLASHVRTLEAAGYTVTPPDPLAADREFLAWLMDIIDFPGSAESWRGGSYDDKIPAAMEYLRANKGRL